MIQTLTSKRSSAIAFFDLDGTLTSKDSLAELLKYIKGTTNYYSGLIILSPVLVAFKLRLIQNQKAKEILLRYFLKGMPANEFDSRCKEFISEKFPKLFRAKGLEEIDRHKKNNTKIVIVSASPVNWVGPLCEQLQLDCIASRMEVIEGRITGNLLGCNCHGEEKVKRIKESYDLAAYSEIYAYGDSRGDLPMLSLASHKFYKPFR